MDNSYNIQKIFAIIGKELRNIQNKDIEFNITAKNFDEDGFDLVWNHNGLEEGTNILHSIERKIRIDNKIWFDSGFDKNGREWNLDWSIELYQ